MHVASHDHILLEDKEWDLPFQRQLFSQAGLGWLLIGGIVASSPVLPPVSDKVIMITLSSLQKPSAKRHVLFGRGGKPQVFLSAGSKTCLAAFPN